MTLIPKSRFTNLLKRQKPQTEASDIEVVAHKSSQKSMPANEYFTFDKDGELIDVNDEEVVALEREIEHNWREAYLASVQGEDESA